MTFDISNHPILSAITRTADVTGINVNAQDKEITIFLKIQHYLNGIIIPELVKDIALPANNTMQIPFPTPENPENTIGEYDYWDYATENGTPLKFMIETGVAETDLNGRINAKCNYRE